MLSCRSILCDRVPLLEPRSWICHKLGYLRAEPHFLLIPHSPQFCEVGWWILDLPAPYFHRSPPVSFAAISNTKTIWTAARPDYLCSSVFCVLPPSSMLLRLNLLQSGRGFIIRRRPKDSRETMKRLLFLFFISFFFFKWIVGTVSLHNIRLPINHQPSSRTNFANWVCGAAPV